jgi:hypothetical protein
VAASRSGGDLVAKELRIADLKHRVALCTASDVVVDGSTMDIRRETVKWAWAAIEHQTHMSSFLSRAGYAALENAARPTHRIRVRTGLELDYSATAWVYEQRLKSPPRWYKFLGFVEEGCFTLLECHLQERNDDARPSDGPLAPAPQSVEL